MSTASSIQQLSAELGERVVLCGSDIPERSKGLFGAVATPTAALLRPTSTEEVSRILAICNAAGQPVVPQGGLTGLVDAADTDEETVALSLERMNQIESIDPVNRTMVVQAGVPLQVVQEAAEEHGLMFPLDLGARGTATIGGNISTNAGGNRVIRYGMMRENVLGLEAVLADGSVVSSMHPMIKNNTGYDLKQLFIGGEGTLGVVTRAVLRLRPQPLSQNVAFVAVPDFDRVLQLLGRLESDLGGTLSAFEVMWRDFYHLLTTEPATNRRPIEADTPYYVLVEALGADQDADAARFEAVLTRVFEDEIIADAAIAQSQGERDQLWAMRDDVGQTGRNAPIQTFDVSLPIGDIERYIGEVNRALGERWPGYTNMVFGHLGDGNVHVIVGMGSREHEDRHRVEEIVYGCLKPYGGSVSAEHGVGLEKKEWLGVSRSDSELAVMRLIKGALDPNGILNPGKIF